MDENFSNDDDEVVLALLLDDDEELDIDDSIDEIDEIDESVEALFENSESNLLEPQNAKNPETTDDVVVDTFIQRRQQRFMAQSRSKKQWLLITAGVIVSIVALVFLILESPIYNVDKITVTNTSTAQFSQAEAKKIDAAVLSLKGDPMYRLDANNALKEIKAMPTIASVSVSKTWPGNITFTIKRRAPVAYIQTDKAIVLVDETGKVYEKVDKIPEPLPSFEGIDEVTYTKNVSNPTFVKVLKSAPEQIKGQISHVRLDDNKYIVELTDGIDIILGDNTQLKEKLAISWSVLLTKKRSDLGYIDVSVPTLPVSGSPQLQV